MNTDSSPTGEAGDDGAPLRALIAQLTPRYAAVLGDEFVADTARAAFTEIRASARVEQFVALLAQRRAEEQLHQALAAAAGGSSTTAS
jgi:hypothetical protein